MSRLHVQQTPDERAASLEREVAALRRTLLARTGWMLRGAGSPEGVVEAPVGTMWLRTDGGTGTTLYIKETGTGASGWAAK
jgi:hypothetical protein